MRCVNLIPAQRRQTKARRRHLTRWSIGLVVYGGAVLAAHFVCGSYFGMGNRALAAEIQRSTARLRAAHRMTLTARGELVRAAGELKSARAVGGQPDWGVLLALLAKNVGDDVVLEFCRLRPVGRKWNSLRGSRLRDPGTAGQPPLALDSPLLLELSGLGLSQTAVSGFILRLERTGLFDQVRLVKSSRRAFLHKKAIAFRLECLLAGRGEGT